MITASATASILDHGAHASQSQLNGAPTRNIIGDSISFQGSAHRFHANVLAALDHPSSPLHTTLGTGPTREYIGVAKEFRNKWKDIESRPEDSFLGHERAAEVWDQGKLKRYENVLRDLKLEELLGSVLKGLEEAGKQAEAETERHDGLLRGQGKSVGVADGDFDMPDAPFEVMAEHGGHDYEGES